LAMAYTEREITELNKAAEQLAELYAQVKHAQFSRLEARVERNETVHLYERADAFVSSLAPKTKRDERTEGRHYRAVKDAWETLRSEALKKAEA
jgi:hypothetical protein